jgi:hypothetical protein
MPERETRRTRLRQLLDDPKARGPVTRAVARLLAVVIVSIGVLGALVIWHLIRRGRLIRRGLSPPRDVDLPNFDSGGSSGEDEQT